MVTYDPVILSDKMTDQGYRSVTISVAPGRRLTVTVCRVGCTIDEAKQAALDHLSTMPYVKEVST